MKKYDTIYCHRMDSVNLCISNILNNNIGIRFIFSYTRICDQIENK